MKMLKMQKMTHFQESIVVIFENGENALDQENDSFFAKMEH